MRQKKVLAVASGGGHWKQLMLLREAFSNCNVKYVTTIAGLPEDSGLSNYKLVADSNKDKKLTVLLTLFQIFIVVARFRPDVVITTGAAPGLLAIIVSRLFFAKTIWVDSIANGEKLSLGGKVSSKLAHQALTQWSHLANNKNVLYKGSVF
jgi:UDP-N-acetylglucosamine:LPS N-acetylglucosamine transferase